MIAAWLALALSAAPPSEAQLDPPGVVDRAAEVAWESASALRRAGRTLDAAAAFEALAAAHPKSRRAVQALAAAGTLARWELGDTPRAKALWVRALQGPSEVAGSDAAVNELLAVEREEGGPEAEIRLIRSLVSRRTSASYTARLWVRAATIFLDELKRPALALDAAITAVRVADGSTWWDDAAMIEGRAHLALAHHPLALLAFRRVTASHRTILVGGDENSDLLDDAYLFEAKTLEAAGRLREAERAYEELVDEVPGSIYVDDALEKARLLAEARGDMEAARDHRAQLAKMRPGSRFLRDDGSKL